MEQPKGKCNFCYIITINEKDIKNLPVHPGMKDQALQRKSSWRISDIGA